MHSDRLSPEEQETLNAYEAILARGRNALYGNPAFWRPEFDFFKTLLPQGSIVDIGCGAGRDALLFTKDPAYRYIGIDLSEAMIKEAKKLVSDADFRVMSMYALDFPDASFDGFWAATSLLHIPKSKLSLVLAEIWRVLQPGGVGFIVVKEGAGEQMVQGKQGEERFFSFYTQGEFAEKLQAGGFVIIHQARDMREYAPPACENIFLLYFVQKPHA